MTLRSPAPDPDGMRARTDDAVWAWIDGRPLTPVQRRIVDMTMLAGGCSSCGTERP